MGHHKHRPGRHAPLGVWRIPDGERIDDFEWVPVGKIKHDALILEEMWARWRKVKDQLDAEWKAEQLDRVRLIGLEIDRDRQDQLLRDEEAREQAWLLADAQDTAMWGRRYQDAVNRVVGKLIKTEERKLRNLNRVIGQHTAKQKLGAFRERTGRRG